MGFQEFGVYKKDRISGQQKKNHPKPQGSHNEIINIYKKGIQLNSIDVFLKTCLF